MKGHVGTKIHRKYKNAFSRKSELNEWEIFFSALSTVSAI